MSKRSRHSKRVRARRREATARATKPEAKRRFFSARGLLLSLILIGVLFSSVYPMKRYFAVRASIKTLEQQELTLDRGASELAAEKRRLQTDAAVEQLAREQLGLVKVGEVPFAVVQPGARAPAVVRPPVVADDRGSGVGPSMWSRFWGLLKRSTRSLR